MSEHQIPAPTAQPERPNEAETLRDTQRSQPKGSPELARKPRFRFTDFAMI